MGVERIVASAENSEFYQTGESLNLTIRFFYVEIIPGFLALKFSVVAGTRG